MKKPRIPVLLFLTIIFAAFTVGFFLGRNQRQNTLSVSVANSCLAVPTSEPETIPIQSEDVFRVSFPVSLNEANKEELMALPGIGEVLAQRIIDYRTENGRFAVPEELLNVDGVGEKRLEEIMELITIGG